MCIVPSFVLLIGVEVLNSGLDVQDDEYKERAARLLTMNAPRVTELLAMYLQAPGAF